MTERPNAPVKLSLPLKYQQDLFNELRNEDELVILARGLGLLRIVTNLLHAFDAAGNNLIIVVGADDRENEWIGEALAEHYAISKTPLARGLKVINTDRATVPMREKIYNQGGILSVTSRILVVDLLSKLLDPEKITGIILLHAERVVATALEAFIVRVYRQFNKNGFLKAFSDSPEPFTTGFAPLSNGLRNLFLRKPSLWPRFHVTVAESLEGRYKAEVIELEVPMTDKMRDIQSAVMECVETSVSELKKANSGLDMEDWTLDSALHSNFDVAIRRQLDPIWHRVSFRTRQIVNDLTVLRAILHSLLTYDAVSLLKYLDTVVAAHSAPPGSTRHSFSPWLFLDAAHVLFETAKSRVYRGKITGAFSAALQPVLEEQPKWQVLAEILQEIEQDAYLNPTQRGDSNSTVLIMCGDQRTCRQLRDFLSLMHTRPVAETDEDEEGFDEDKLSEESTSAEIMMRRKLREYLNWKQNFSRVKDNLYAPKPNSNEAPNRGQSSSSASGRAPPNKRRRVRGGGSSSLVSSRAPNTTVQGQDEAPIQVSKLLDDLQPCAVEEALKEDNVIDNLEDMEDFYELYDMNDLVMIHPYDGDMDERILEEARPRYIIMYEPDAAFIRRVEVYRSSHNDRNVRVYFMYYGGSVEEQRYLSTVRREKDAFTKLITEKGGLAVTLTHDKILEDPEEQFLRTVNTRIAGGGRLAATAAPPTVVVDVREFRSALPSLLHGRSMVVVPCQLTVGDYVLTPDICVERKSVRDLISSLKNGRLYNQAETMLKHYKNPLLLIEFEQNKSFTFDAFASASLPSTSFLSDYVFTSSGNPASAANSSLVNPSTPKSAQHMLVLLTLAFPRLKIIWSSSPYQTAEIFAELKKNNPEPDPIKAVQIGLNVDIAASSHPGDVMAAAGIEHRVFHQLPQDMLRAVPGVTPVVLERLSLETNSIHEIANMDVEDLDPLVGKETARKITRFFRKSVFEDETEGS
ncbi:DNA repair protein RAD1, putative [Talaromyces stipitatus ATCC 10500]|uniref:DNA repair protein RAD1, putative n=1 Tax=Talaromyces stipitatus (strain ATCC 10500 / CBS 375.48 / QM 6759 / NRRL 1006) TaxID=441959 RepID=B8M4V0_TALSN|nr:DNA repair protein RAD1, putative [Talaromyces stipitatus ATCC 10500]EED19385.1 DNA repair protein RAD1, putative [Talaromyces stipitatus ATCC 10500]